ncbi:PTS sugar transporter subunit IIB [Paenibacillus macerans]|uniref:PTS sugar transporter subunit IIB n=1 Tax=Paenibacillus macerans TaxID=44252 RepID=UPI00203C18C2|nr:PTS sugar transporter subunit IIB [Paenibacillus macerans]MCM3699689.1 PTS sugar transporter subunit IIB [Paenibacillus macerans]
MDKIRILLCCGGGFSSGMLAQKSRKAANKAGLNASVEARSESQVSEYLDKIDVLLLGPHYEKNLNNFSKLAAPFNVPVAVIPKEIYGMIDGEKLLEFALSLVEHKER